MRFTLRDLMWVMVLVGLALLWWLDRARERLPLVHSHENLLQLRQYLGEKTLNDLIATAKSDNLAPPNTNSLRPTTLVINLPKPSPPPATTAPASPTSRLPTNPPSP